MDKILIFFLCTLILCGYHYTATIVYAVWLATGFIGVTWRNLTVFPLLYTYTVYGVFGLFSMLGCFIALFAACFMYMLKFDQSNPHDTNQTEQTNQTDRITSVVRYINNPHIDRAYDTMYPHLKPAYDKFYIKYVICANGFNKLVCWVSDTVYGFLCHFRSLTSDMPYLSQLYAKYDNTILQVSSVTSADYRSKMLDLYVSNALEAELDAKDANHANHANHGADVDDIDDLDEPAEPTTKSINNWAMNPDMLKFDMAQLAELERNMTPEQRKKADEDMLKLMQMFGNMDANGDLSKMFGGFNKR